jgi:hypothetical protein
LFKITQQLTYELNRGDVILEIGQVLYKVNITIETKINEYHRFVLFDWIYQHILKLKSFYFIVSYSKCNNDGIDSLHNEIDNIILKFSKNIISSYIVEGNRQLVITPIDSNCKSYVYLSDLVKYEIKIVLYTLLAVFIVLCLAIFLFLFAKGYFNWIIFYFKKEFSLLPFQISWSLVLYQRFPFRVSYLTPYFLIHLLLNLNFLVGLFWN